MKKIFHLTQKNKHPDRVLESIKYEIRKYLKRERGKKLPENAIFWDFDSAFGEDELHAEKTAVSKIISLLDKAKQNNWEKCYIEIIAKPSFRAT